MPSIDRKTVLIVLFMVAVITVMAALQYRSVNNYQSLGEMRSLASDIQSNVLTLRRNEKDFFARTGSWGTVRSSSKTMA